MDATLYSIALTPEILFTFPCSKVSVITDLSLKLKRLSRISAKKAIFAANFVKPCPKSSRDSAFSPSDLTHRKSAPLNMGVSKTLTPYIAIWKFVISSKISANGQLLAGFGLGNGLVILPDSASIICRN